MLLCTLMESYDFGPTHNWCAIDPLIIIFSTRLKPNILMSMTTMKHPPKNYNNEYTEYRRDTITVDDLYKINDLRLVSLVQFSLLVNCFHVQRRP